MRGHEKAAGVAATAIARCCGRFPPCCRHGSLLKDPHILLLVFIYGLFSVRRVDGSSRARGVGVRKSCSDCFSGLVKGQKVTLSWSMKV